MVRNEVDYEKIIWADSKIDIKNNNIYTLRIHRLIKSMKNKLTKDDLVLEIGCAAGGQLRAIKEYYDIKEAYGCDISKNSITKARNKNDEIKYSICDAEKLPYPDNMFDFIYMFDLLEHVKDPNKVIKEIKRVLKPKSNYHIFVPIENQDRTLFSYHKKYNDVPIQELKKKYYGHIQCFNETDIFDICVNNNFYITDLSYSYHFFGQILDIVELYYINKQRCNKSNIFWKVLHKIVFMIFNKLAYYEDYLRRNDKKGIGIHLTMINIK